jgi:hypothetical protein
MNREEVIRWAREAHHDLVTKDYPGHLGQLDPWTIRLLERFAALAYAAGAAAERTQYENTLALQQQSYEREIKIEVEAEREACIEDCNAEARDDGTAQRIVERIQARGQS